MKKIRADYIFPISGKPIKDGILIFEKSGEIIDVLDPADIDYEVTEVETQRGIICPGFVNAHCHLELSYLKRKIQKGTGLNDFILQVEKQKIAYKGEQTIIMESMEMADDDMLNSGIVAVGDISNTDSSYEVKKSSKIKYYNFIEVFGSDPKHAERIFDKAYNLFKKFNNLSETSIVPHSAYSVSAELFKRIKEFSIEHFSVLSIHHQENEDENDLFMDKTGKIMERAEVFGIDMSHFNSTGKRPLESIAEYLPQNNHLQLVHNTVSGADDILFAVSTFPNVWFCLCPGSNKFIENKLPMFALFNKHHDKITIGTDSLASNEELSLLEEMKLIQKNDTETNLEQLLQCASLNGARYLKIDDSYGSFDKGKRPGINLIEFIDLKNMKLISQSRIIKIDN